MNIPRPPQFRIFPLLLGLVLLLAQLGLVYHQTEHSLGEPDKICLSCQAADHMQHGLAAASFAGIIPVVLVPAGIALSSVFPQSFRAPSARAPPASLLY